MSVSTDSMRVILEGNEQREVSFDLREYGSVEHGYAATVHKAQGTTVEHAFVLATPGMDRHLAYVGMTRHREEARLYAGNDDFKNFEALKERLSRARPKDTTLDYAQRRGFEVAVEQLRKAPEREPAQGMEQTLDPIQRFKVAQRDFIGAAGRFDLDPDAKLRASEARQQMKSAAEEISKNASMMRHAERAGIVDQVKSLTPDNHRGLSKEKGFEMER
jgi:hypothetical protein